MDFEKTLKNIFYNSYILKSRKEYFQELLLLPIKKTVKHRIAKLVRAVK
jgi:hypothetical protein